MSVPLGRQELLDGLLELAQRLDNEGIAVTLHIVGGAAILLAVDPSRRATVDVDSWINTQHPADRVRVLDAARLIAARRGWPDDWVNDKARLFIPESVSGGLAEWVPVLAVGAVRVVAARADVLLVMKLRAGRASRDLNDLPPLIVATGLTTGSEIQDLFDRMYPDEEIRRLSRLWIETHLD